MRTEGPMLGGGEDDDEGEEEEEENAKKFSSKYWRREMIAHDVVPVVGSVVRIAERF